MELVGVWLEEEDKKKLEQLAKEDDRPLSNFCRQILLQYLKEAEKAEKKRGG